MAKAYSYLRFSTAEQLKGDSLRRQTALAREYAASHSLEFDETLSYRDEAVSAYHNKNARGGALKTFLEAVEHGVVAQGSYLLVESLDRISRDQIVDAQALFMQIIRSGVTLVTLGDRKEYSEASLNASPIDMIVSLLGMMRAHEESKTKGRRVGAAWAQKRANGGETKLTKLCPGWLTLSDDRKKFTAIPARAKVVKRIFRMTLEGAGQHAIARTLNEEKVPAFKATFWQRSYIAKLLSSPAVVGTFVPHSEQHRGGRTIRIPAEPIKKYFPAVITDSDFERVQSLRKEGNNPMRGRHAARPINNVLGGLAKCAKCGATMTVTNKSNDWRYFVCTKAKAGAGCTYKAIPYGDVERALVDDFHTIAGECPSATKEGRSAEAEMEAVRNSIDGTEEAMARLLEALEQTGKRPAAALQRITEHEEEVAKLKAREEVLHRRVSAASRKILDAKLEQASKAMAAVPIDRHAANTALRQLLASAVIDEEEGRITFQWHHGGESGITYRYFRAEKVATLPKTKAKKAQRTRTR